MESDNLSCEQVSSALTSAGIGNHAVRPHNGRLFPLTANSDHVLSHLSLRTYFFIYILVKCNTTIPPDLHPWWAEITKEESNKQFHVTYIR